MKPIFELLYTPVVGPGGLRELAGDAKIKGRSAMTHADLQIALSSDNLSDRDKAIIKSTKAELVVIARELGIKSPTVKDKATLQQFILQEYADNKYESENGDERGPSFLGWSDRKAAYKAALQTASERLIDNEGGAITIYEKETEDIGDRKIFVLSYEQIRDEDYHYVGEVILLR